MEALKKIIDDLTQEAAQIQIQGRALRPDEMARVQAIYQALPHLKQALDILSVETASTLITYKIVSDADGKIKRTARVACNFWNKFIVPSSSIVIRLGVFTENSDTIAVSYKPHIYNDVIYGRIEFNTKFLSDFTDNEIAGTIVHEIGHTLGFGWDIWMGLFNDDGIFTNEAINALCDLEYMRVETEGGDGTRYSHWSEKRHGAELMTGYKNSVEHVLPMTIKIMRLFGHQVVEELPQKSDLDTLLSALSQVVFSRKSEAKAINLDHFEQTEIMEHIPHI